MYQLVNSNKTDRFSWDAEAEQAYWLAQEQKHILAPLKSAWVHSMRRQGAI